MWLSRSKKRVGYNAQGRGFLLTENIELPQNKIHRSLKYLQLIGERKFNKDEKFILEIYAYGFIAEYRWFSVICKMKPKTKSW